MATSVLASALRHARSSWLGQLGVLAASAVLLGFVVASGDIGTDLLLRATIGLTILLVLLAASVRMAFVQPEQLSSDHLLEELLEAVMVLPRLLVQVTVAAGPALALSGLTMLLAGPIPLLALLLVPLAFAAWLLTSPIALLAIVAVVHGDREWLPRIAWRAVRARPGALVLATLVGSVAASLAAVPIALFGFVVMALAGIVGVLGVGLAAGAVVPFAGCWAVALWEATGAVVPAPEPALDAPVGAARPAASQHVEPAPWVDGPAWNVAIEAHAVWGTWVTLATAAEIGFRCSWSGSEPPRLLLGREDGTWVDPGAFLRPGATVVVALPAGNTYLQVAVGGAVAQAVSLTMLVRGVAAAA